MMFSSDCGVGPTDRLVPTSAPAMPINSRAFHWKAPSYTQRSRAVCIVNVQNSTTTTATGWRWCTSRADDGLDNGDAVTVSTSAPSHSFTFFLLLLLLPCMAPCSETSAFGGPLPTLFPFQILHSRQRGTAQVSISRLTHRGLRNLSIYFRSSFLSTCLFRRPSIPMPNIPSSSESARNRPCAFYAEPSLSIYRDASS